MAKKLSKRMKALLEKVDIAKEYQLDEACRAVISTASAKFDETVELVALLGVDPRKADQNIRGSVVLPEGLGKEVRVAVFAKGEKAKEAEDAGADIVGGEDLAKKIQEGFLDFDTVISTPDMMAQVGKLGKILGPRGLMPSPKVGTVTFDVADAVKSAKAGKVEFRVDKGANVHAPIGKASFGAERIEKNMLALIEVINKLKPSTSKGVYLKQVFLSVTMGPSIRVNTASLR